MIESAYKAPIIFISLSNLEYRTTSYSLDFSLGKKINQPDQEKPGRYPCQQLRDTSMKYQTPYDSNQTQVKLILLIIQCLSHVTSLVNYSGII